MNRNARNTIGALLLDYTRQRIKCMILFALLIGIFAAVFFLYDLPRSESEAVVYASVLFAAAAGVFAAVDFFSFYRKHRKLTLLLREVTVSLAGLPEPSGALERDYQELLRRLYADRAGIISAADGQREEMVDYYTLWVHQIKTPIAAMKLLLQQEELEGGRGAMRQELFKIEQYAAMALQYQRIESMESDLLLAQYSLDDMVKQAVRKYAPTFIYKKITLDLKETELQILTDEKWLVFVLEQLLSNALKYTPEGGAVSIYAENGAAGMFPVRRENEKAGQRGGVFPDYGKGEQSAVIAGSGKDGGPVFAAGGKSESSGGVQPGNGLTAVNQTGRTILVIEDTGIGIGAEDLPRIFERGFTGRNGRMDKKSTGIGLYLCREILARLSHRIRIESEAGRGTRVSLDLTADKIEVE